MLETAVKVSDKRLEVDSTFGLVNPSSVCEVKCAAPDFQSLDLREESFLVELLAGNVSREA